MGGTFSYLYDELVPKSVRDMITEIGNFFEMLWGYVVKIFDAFISFFDLIVDLFIDPVAIYKLYGPWPWIAVIGALQLPVNIFFPELAIGFEDFLRLPFGMVGMWPYFGLVYLISVMLWRSYVILTA